MPIFLNRLPPGAAAPLGALLFIMPILAVFQFRGLAPAAVIGLAAALAGHWRATGRLPVPARTTTLLLLLPALFCAASAAWAVDPGRALATGLVMAAFLLGGLAMATAVAEEPPARTARMLRWLAWGLGTGILLALADQLTGHALRAAVRGMRDAPITLQYGLKPAVSVIAVLLPLAVCLPRRPWAMALGLGGLASALLLPAESAKIAAVVGLLVLPLAAWAGPWMARGIGMALAAFVLAAPLVFAAALPRLPSLERIPPSAAHRVLIWDFVLERIAERPLLGWGGEASRAIPGGQDVFGEEVLDRYGLTSPASRFWFARKEAQRLPLHTHNAALQVWLELGAVGAVLVALLLLRLGWLAGAAGPAGAGVLAAAGVVGMLSYGIWQEWWIGLLLTVGAALAGWARLRASAAPGSGG